MTERNHRDTVITGGKYTCGEGTKMPSFWTGSLESYSVPVIQVPDTILSRLPIRHRDVPVPSPKKDLPSLVSTMFRLHSAIRPRRARTGQVYSRGAHV